MNDFITRISSTKFLFALAAGLASLGTGLTGLFIGNDNLVIVGGVCLVLSQAIYSFTNAYVTAKTAETKTTTITANTSNAAVVAALTGSTDASNGTVTNA